MSVSNNFNSNPTNRELISLFARYKIEEIEQNSSLIRNLFLEAEDIDATGSSAEINDRILDKTGYKTFYTAVSEQKRSIELILTGSSEMAQVKGILKKLTSLRSGIKENQYKTRIFKALVDAAIDKAGLWMHNPEAIQKYRKGVSMITEWVDFFLSYTNRNQPEVNNTFMKVLAPKFSEEEWRRSVNALNLIAKLLVRYIRERTTLNAVFFDQQSMICGENIEEKVKDYCEKTFAFAQLFQWQIITDNGKKNWCEFEYTTFSKFNTAGNKKEFYFKTYDIPDDVTEVLESAPEDDCWGEWLTKTLSKKQIVISKDADYDDELKQKCREIGIAIRESRKEIITNYLESIQ